MSADLRNAASTLPPSPAAPADARRHARRGWLLMGAGAWNVWLWVTRVWILMHDSEPRTAGFIAVHAVLYGVSFLLGIVLGVMGWRMWREARAAERRG